MKKHRGYSLLELILVMIVVGIFGVMVTITARAVLTSETARAAETNLQDVIVAEQQFAQRYGGFTGFPGDLGNDAAYVVVTGLSRGPGEVSLAVGEQGTLGLSSMRDDDTCIHYRISSLDSGGGSQRLNLGSTAVCTGEEALGDTEARLAGSDTTTATW